MQSKSLNFLLLIFLDYFFLFIRGDAATKIAVTFLRICQVYYLSFSLHVNFPYKIPLFLAFGKFAQNLTKFNTEPSQSSTHYRKVFRRDANCIRIIRKNNSESRHSLDAHANHRPLNFRLKMKNWMATMMKRSGILSSSLRTEF